MTDTTPDAREVQTRIYRRMTGAERLQMALEMSDFVRELSLTRLRSEHPDWSHAELTRELLRYSFGSTPLPPPLR